MSVDADVVVSGIGAIGPWGLGRETLASALAAGRPLDGEVDRGAGHHDEAGSRRAALVPALELGAWLPAAHARRLGIPSRWAVATARMALAEAGIASLEGRTVAVVLATAFGPVRFTESLVRQVLDEGPQAAQPFYFSECVANAAAGQVALAIGARGGNLTVTQREASSLAAVGLAATEVREGRADLALAGAADEMSPTLHAFLDRFRATARARGGLPEAARPFDRRRNGVLAGEGATVVAVERAVDVAARGARPRARILASGSAFDPGASESDWGTGHDRLGRALSRLLARGGVRPGEVDAIVSGASGAVRGDRLEGLTLRAAWGGRDLPPVVAPKGVVGEYGGGMLAATLLAAEGAPFGRLVTFEEPDPEMGITPHAGAPGGPAARVLATALAAGGAASWLLLEGA